MEALKAEMPDFAIIWRLAMRFRGILRGHDIELLDRWLHDAHHSGVYAMQRFAHTLSNVQTEGQISRLKTLKRAMCGRAGTALLRARILPL